MPCGYPIRSGSHVISFHTFDRRRVEDTLDGIAKCGVLLGQILRSWRCTGANSRPSISTANAKVGQQQSEHVRDVSLGIGCRQSNDHPPPERKQQPQATSPTCSERKRSGPASAREAWQEVRRNSSTLARLSVSRADAKAIRHKLVAKTDTGMTGRAR